MSYTLIRLPVPDIIDIPFPDIVEGPVWTHNILFQADFNSAPLTESVTFSNLNTGTQLGSWSGTLSSGKGFIRGSESNNAVLVDRYGGGFVLDAWLESEVPVDGLAVSFRVALRRTGIDKNIYISGLDALGEKSFEMGIDSISPPAPGYVHPVAGFTLIPEGVEGGGVEFMNDIFYPDSLREITVYLNATNYWVCYENGVWVSSELPFLGTASQLAQVRFSANSEAGLWLDDVFVVHDPDRNGDGLPDHYEIRNFDRPISESAEMDIDLDGMDNYSEFIAGTDPLDPHSYLGVTASAPSGGVFRLEWNAVSGRVYSVEGTSDLLEPFVPLATNLLFPQQDYTVDLSYGTNRFYRIQVGNE